MKTNKKTYLTPETATLSLEVRNGVMYAPSANMELPTEDKDKAVTQYPTLH